MTVPEDKIQKWYDFLSGKGELAADIACYITDSQQQLEEKDKEIEQLTELLEKVVKDNQYDYLASNNLATSNEVVYNHLDKAWNNFKKTHNL